MRSALEAKSSGKTAHLKLCQTETDAMGHSCSTILNLLRGAR